MSLQTVGITYRPTPPVESGQLGNTNVLCTVAGIDPALALDSATDLLDAVRGALLELIQHDDQQAARIAAIALHANESAAALVQAAIEASEVPA